MNPRLAKELRPLLFPWSVAAIAAVGHLAGLASPTFAGGAFGSLLIGLAGTAFVIGVLVLAAMPIAIELQDRTLMLLLTQPTERLRLWKEKILASTVAIVALGIVHGIASGVTGHDHLSLSVILLCAAFALAAICSIGYYTLATRSLLIGIACAVAMPYGIAACFYLIVSFVLGLQIQLSEQATVTLIVVACIAYSMLYIWLSRRQFVQHELRDVAVSRAAEVPAALIPRKLTEILRGRRTGGGANLVRKEISLQKPIFLVSAVFTACWLITLFLMLLRPVWRENLVAVFHGLTATQIVLAVILAGCVSLGDDRALGTAAWHLTLPISARRQWMIKLLVSAGTLVAVAVVLPLLLAMLTSFNARVGLLAMHQHDAPEFVLVGGIVFLLSFWSASMAANTVRAAIMTMLWLFVFGAVMVTAYNFAEQWTGIRSVTIPDAPAHRGVYLNMLLGIAGVAAIALTQSLQQFRRLDVRKTIWLRNAAILATAIFALTIWGALD
jgi:hypothetical protein